MAGRPRTKSDDNSFISKQLRKLIGGKSFSEFERINQLPVRTLQRIMDGNDPRISTLSMIAKSCNVTLDYFFDGSTSQKIPSPAETRGEGTILPQLSRLAVELVSELNDIHLRALEGVVTEEQFRAILLAATGSIAAAARENGVETKKAIG